ncbi:fluoride efflux transporter FluC [Trueperella bialowiezensis]|uniref:Fluoride-specific ion channel FluC n=1 Tax=Trueperella bialowiezensis TaxID=312285 RepID=A0A448PC54_9ACTO|nr:CrcB family protein [Trueperella bialowiezensis]VEI12555.1 camphor resistance protein CrcB [Trueperella bialowiezensis]
MVELLAVAIGGGFGAAARYGVDSHIPKPWGTVAVNFAGSFLLGLLVGVLRGSDAFSGGGTLSDGGKFFYALAGTGFCGGFTTFSTAAVQSIDIGVTDDSLNGGTYALIMLGGSVACAGLGMALGVLLAR